MTSPPSTSAASNTASAYQPATSSPPAGWAMLAKAKDRRTACLAAASSTVATDPIAATVTATVTHSATEPVTLTPESSDRLGTHYIRYVPTAGGLYVPTTNLISILESIARKLDDLAKATGTEGDTHETNTTSTTQR